MSSLRHTGNRLWRLARPPTIAKEAG
jgi:hypothetical protein